MFVSDSLLLQFVNFPLFFEFSKPNLKFQLTSWNSLRLGMDGDGEELTAQETALYDRQIRVWGADAQRRFSTSFYFLNYYYFKFDFVTFKL